MRAVTLVVLPLLVASCVDTEEEQLGERESAVIIDNRIALNRIALNRIALNRIALNRIALNRIALNRLQANLDTVGDLLTTPDGLELFSFVVSCALDHGDVLEAPNPKAGIGDEPDVLEFPGELGLAPRWENHRLHDSDERWVSACLLARVNQNNVTVSVSLRGADKALRTTAAERAAFTLDEGAFFGDVFVDEGEPLEMFACRGFDQANRPSPVPAVLTQRTCTIPDPANPGQTLCGDADSAIAFAGECADACKKQADDGSYRDCKPDDGDDRGHGRGKYREVIATFLQP